MKTKILLALLSLLLVLSFTACDDDGDSEDSMDEVYAGTWYGTWFDYSEVKADVYDNSYESWYWDYGWVKSQKGIIEKISDGVITVQCTKEYDSYYGEWETVPSNLTTGSYTMGEGDTTMTLTVTSTNAQPDVEVGDTAYLSKTPTY